MIETKWCISCGFKIPDVKEKQYYNYKTGEKIYFCRFCNSIFVKLITQEEVKND